MGTEDTNQESIIKTNVEKIKEQYSDDEIRRQIEEFGQMETAEKEKPRVLYLDDEQDALDNFKGLFRKMFKVYTANNAEEARRIVADENLQVILTDQRMPDITGVEFLKSIIDQYPDPIRVLVTGYSDIQAVIEAINDGQIYKYISKPYPMEAMKQTIENAVEVFSLRREKEELIQKLARANSQLDFMLRQKLLG